MLARLTIEDVRPSTPAGMPAKAVVGERVPVSATVFRDGHDILAARVRWRAAGAKTWHTAPLRLVEPGLDQWAGELVVDEIGHHELQIEAWTDRFATWRHDAEIKASVGDPDLETVLEEGARLLDRLAKRVDKPSRSPVTAAAKGLRDASLSVDERLTAGLDEHVASLVSSVPDPIDLTRTKPAPLWVDRPRGRFGAWYEMFPRSEGGLDAASKRLPDIAAMGFDVVYLPPVHPIGHTFRKGRDNTTGAGPDDPGSPWAIGSEEGGHLAVQAELGTIDDFDAFVDRAHANGLEVALDYALQCSPDHPWVRDHPEWFYRRADGSIAYAENPPKKYQDIYPINFWPQNDQDRKALWEACKEIFDFWIAHGVLIFRVDNPHTKPFAFWDWMINAVRDEHPDVVLLAEAFTRPRVMSKLAELGFTQSYTYFAWRVGKWELEAYLNELAHGPIADWFRPNFWPNTPDILSGPLRNGPPSAFRLRLLLAATMSPSYGIYSGYELCENEPASDANEEYLHSEKYEIKARDWDREDSLAPFVTLVNDIRHRHDALAELRTLVFHHTDSDDLIAYSKRSGDGGDVILCVVNLDPHGWHEATLFLDLAALGIEPGSSVDVYDEMTGASYTWTGDQQYIRLDPSTVPGHVFDVRPH
ncbi:MAG TPA: alpha-1,4-glucan--maltose-1-phosphate maltosyltransferase [Acidimicrobiales bacterium]|nr:alpha-1,4-glucan--maltose-1-phosphate maltosyltransferase [Acidimicrobiales bacterium]